MLKTNKSSFPTQVFGRLLHAIGLTQEEIKILLFHPDMNSKLNTSVLVDFNQLVGEKFGGDIAAFCETLRRRLEIIRAEGQNLGVDNIFDVYKFLVNWEEAMAALDRAAQEQSDVSLLLKFQDTMSSGLRNSCRVSLQTLPTSSGVTDVNIAGISSLGCEAYLKKLFNLYRSNGERTKAFKATLRRIPHHKEVPTAVVREAEEWLQEREGFSIHQIERGFPTLLYSVPIIEAAITRADNKLEEGWREREDALCLLHYFIELQSGFDFSLIHEGIGSLIKDQHKSYNSDILEERSAKTGRLEDWDDDLDEEVDEVEDWTTPAFPEPGPRRCFLSPSSSSSMLSSSFSTSSTSLGNNDEGERKSKLKIKMSSSRVKKDEPFKLDEKLPGLELKPGQVHLRLSTLAIIFE